jgi:pyruvate dehydrogenase phosphatase
MSIKYTDMDWPELDALWIYHSLSEPVLSSELARVSDAKSFANHTDHLSFQPCPNPEERNQDRHIVQDWSLANGTWKFCGIFDGWFSPLFSIHMHLNNIGHAGHDTVDYVFRTLPNIINLALTSALENSNANMLSPEVISDILARSIHSVDNNMTEDLLRLFPDPAFIAQLSNDEISATINDIESGGANLQIIARCMRGSTVLVSLVDPSGSNLWVASLGDSEAGNFLVFALRYIHPALVLGICYPDGHWAASRLSSFHNGENHAEKTKIKTEHPGEADCIINDRVLGALAVTRGTSRIPQVLIHG